MSSRLRSFSSEGPTKLFPSILNKTFWLLMLKGSFVFEIGNRHTMYRSQAPLGLSLWTSTRDTVIYWIQNSLGAQKWPITKESVHLIRESFVPR